MAVLIRDVKCFVTAPDRANLVVVRVDTTEPGLYGLGCATFTQRALAVKTAVDEYLRPLMIGRNVANIEDAWQIMYGQSYWRNGPVLNNAISGVDEALWDIKGKMAGMPVYDLLGGKCREGARVYVTVHGNTYDEFDRNLSSLIEQGFTSFRTNPIGIGGNAQSDPELDVLKPEGAPYGNYFDPKKFMDLAEEMASHVREKFGYGIDISCDVHEKLNTDETVMLAERLDRYRMYFIEDSLMPEQQEWLGRIRTHTTTPIAMGELYNNINEIRPVIEKRQIDYLRCHVSQIGGLTPARKLAVLCELYGVKTAWHGPGDLSPVGLSAQLHLDLASPAFGIQEYSEPSELRREMFPGCPELRGGYLYPSGRPGLGIEFNEEMAAKYPPKPFAADTWQGRRPDGTAVRT